MRRKAINVILGLFVALVFGLAGCGGGGSSSPAPTATGKFVDAPVEGLKYVSGGQSGFTGPNGEFTYEVGQSVTFSVGGVIVGQAPGASTITPITLVQSANPGTTVTTDTPAVIQMAQFLLTASSLTSTGIKIDPAVTTASTSQNINLSTASTSSSSAMTNQIAVATNRDVTNTTDAQAHITASMNGLASGIIVLPPVTIIGGSTNYYPLQVGNKWVYTSLVPGKYRNDEVTGTEIINGISAFIKERLEPSPDNNYEKRWLVYDTSSVLLLRFWGNEGADPAIDFSPPSIEFKLSPQVGDKWSLFTRINFEVLSLNDTVTVPSGTFMNCIKIKDTDSVSGKVHLVHYAPNIGMIRNEQPGVWVEELVFAKVGSKLYGTSPL